MEKKLTDEEIVSALEHCEKYHFECNEDCNLYGVEECTVKLCNGALDLIRRLQYGYSSASKASEEWKDKYESLKVELGKELVEHEEFAQKAKAEIEEWEKLFDISNEREYRKKFNEEWKKEYQKELDKQGEGTIAGFPDFDLVYKLFFEQREDLKQLARCGLKYLEALGNEQRKSAEKDKEIERLTEAIKSIKEMSAEQVVESEKLKQSCAEAVNSFVRLETLYKVKCKELEIANKKLEELKGGKAN